MSRFVSVAATIKVTLVVMADNEESGKLCARELLSKCRVARRYPGDARWFARLCRMVDQVPEIPVEEVVSLDVLSSVYAGGE